jgi:ubiquinone/menaquinone biosynthesis C-methylase UbiE
MIPHHSHLNRIDTAAAPHPPWETMEIVRQMKLHRMLTHVLGGPLPGSIDLSNVRRVLDLGCGAGDWVLEMAYHHRQMHVIGIDHCRAVVEYARARAGTQGMENASFAAYDFFHLSETSFPSESFDLLHLSFLTGSMPVAAFPGLLRDLQRLCRRGGGVFWCELDVPHTNSRACMRFTRMMVHALRKAGLAFCPNPLTLGMTTKMVGWLEEAGYGHIRQCSLVVDVSAGTAANFTFVEQVEAIAHIIEPFLLPMEVTTAEELDVLRNKMGAEMRLDSFSGKVFLKSVWAERGR